jgi:hypothetical protein
MTDRDRQRDILAKHLARYYSRPGQEPFACACDPATCHEIGCYHWWYSFLGRSKSSIVAMMLLYEEAYALTRRDDD